MYERKRGDLDKDKNGILFLVRKRRFFLFFFYACLGLALALSSSLLWQDSEVYKFEFGELFEGSATN